MQLDDGCDIFWIAYGEYNGRRAVKPFVRYLVAKARMKERHELWELYVAESIHLLPNENLANRYSDVLKIIANNGKEKTGDEIVHDIMTKHGLSFG